VSRHVVNIIELAAVTSALAVAVVLLGDAAYRPGSIAWTPAVLAGAITALALAFIAAALFVGWLAVDAAQNAKRAWRLRRAIREREAKTRERAEHAGRHGRPVTAADRAAVGYEPVAGGR
jgi:hypothetical protein